MMNTTVEVKAWNVMGPVVDMNEAGTTLWVEMNNDWVAVPAELAVEVVVPVVEVAAAKEEETLAEKFADMLQAEGLEYDAYSEGEDDATFAIEGNIYSVMITINADGNHYCETTHKERMEREDDIFNVYGDTDKAYANSVTRKTLKGALNYAIKFADK